MFAIFFNRIYASIIAVLFGLVAWTTGMAAEGCNVIQFTSNNTSLAPITFGSRYRPGFTAVLPKQGNETHYVISSTLCYNIQASDIPIDSYLHVARACSLTVQVLTIPANFLVGISGVPNYFHDCAGHFSRLLPLLSFQ
jgi:hypothetical protein